MVRSESKRSFCGAGKNNKMATAVRLPRRHEVTSDRILNKLNENTFLLAIIKNDSK